MGQLRTLSIPVVRRLRRRLRATPAEFQILSVPLALTLRRSYLLAPQDRQRVSTGRSACQSLAGALSVNEGSGNCGVCQNIGGMSDHFGPGWSLLIGTPIQFDHWRTCLV